MGRGMACAAALGALFHGGCTPAPLDLFLTFPPDPAARTLVFVTPTPSGPTWVTVDAASAPDFVLLLEDEEVEVPDVEVLAFTETPDELELEPGPIPEAAAGEIGRPLPDPAAVYRLRYDAEAELASWEERSEISSASASFRTRVCERIETVGESWSVDGFARFAVSLDGEHVLFGTDYAGTTTVFVSDGGPPVIATNAPSGSASPYAVWRGPGDSVWYGDFYGRIWRARASVRGIFDEAIAFDFEDPFARVQSIDGHVAAGGDVEIFAVTEHGRVVRGEIDGGVGSERWTVASGTVDGEELRIMWRGPGEATVAVWETTVMARVENDTILRDAGPDAEVFSVRWVPEVGEVVGGGNGELYRRAGDERWQQLGPAFSIFVDAIEPAPRGFVYLLASGRVGRYEHPWGLCPNEAVLPVLGADGVLAPLGDDFFAAGELNSSHAVTQGARFRFLR